MGMDFRGQVCKRVGEMAYFGLNLGQDLGNRAAHPYREFREVPPRESAGLQSVFVARRFFHV